MCIDAKGLSFAAAMIAATLSSPILAAPFDCVSEPGYCIGVGETVIFRFSGTESTMGLFGRLEVIGDSIVSFPTDFRAESNDASQATVNDNGSVQVIAQPGYRFDSVTIVERGAYSMSAADSSVAVTALMEVADWNDQIFGPVEGRALSLLTPLTDRTGVPASWRMSGTIDMTGAPWNAVDEISLSLVNNLYATGNSGTAWIEKLVSGAGLDVSVATSVIPVPAAAWLLGSGLIGLVGVARRPVR